MRFEDKDFIVILCGLALLIALWIPSIASYLPSKDEPFLELAILGETGRAEKYFPDDDPNINIDEQVNWSIHLYNHLGKNTYVLLRLKLLNSINEAPQSDLCIPSPASTIYEIKQILEKNQTILLPLSWSIKNMEEELGSINIQTLNINKEDINVNVSETNGNRFRIIIELWVYNEGSEQLEFGWEGDEGKRCAWIQIWFNANLN